MSTVTLVNLKRILLLVMSVFEIAACSSSGGSPLNTREDFDTWQTSNDGTAFRYTLTWYVPPDQLFGNERNSFIASLGLHNSPVRRPFLSLNNEDKLRLEDYAVQLLKNKMSEKTLCPDGYLINETRWHEQSVVLAGHCN